MAYGSAQWLCVLTKVLAWIAVVECQVSVAEAGEANLDGGPVLLPAKLSAVGAKSPDLNTMTPQPSKASSDADKMNSKAPPASVKTPAPSSSAFQPGPLMQANGNAPKPPGGMAKTDAAGHSLEDKILYNVSADARVAIPVFGSASFASPDSDEDMYAKVPVPTRCNCRRRRRSSRSWFGDPVQANVSSSSVGAQSHIRCPLLISNLCRSRRSMDVAIYYWKCYGSNCGYQTKGWWPIKHGWKREWKSLPSHWNGDDVLFYVDMVGDRKLGGGLRPSCTKRCSGLLHDQGCVHATKAFTIHKGWSLENGRWQGTGNCRTRGFKIVNGFYSTTCGFKHVYRNC